MLKIKTVTNSNPSFRSLETFLAKPLNI